MKDTSCPRCGSVFTSHGDSLVCPHCGLDCGTAWSELRVSSSRYLRLAFIFGWPAAICITVFAKVDWKYGAIALLVLALGLGWSYVLQKTRREYHDSTAALNVHATKTNSIPTIPAPLRLPEAPREWKSLISVARPREVYLPFDARLITVMVTLLWVVTGWVWFSAVNHRGTLIHATNWRSSDWVSLLYLTIGVFWTIAFVRRETAARTFLRAGEITVGYWNDGAYQFWTRSGERFRHASSIVAPENAITDAGLVPVFYLQSDPTKSIALCGTYSRVRIMAGDGPPEIAEISASS